ncbi:MAG: hypothetical protein V1489_02635 [Candidatus Liptonbacteria bacterium]
MNTSSIGRREIIIIVAVVVAVALAFAAYHNRKDADNNAEQQGAASSTAASGSGQAASSTPSSTQSNTTPAKSPSLTYTQAVNLYAGKRIQFDANCTVQPIQLIVKNNTTIMLDNRGPQSRAVYLDRAKYTLPAFGYKTVRLSYTAIPKTIIVDCGTGRNNATIIVQ